MKIAAVVALLMGCSNLVFADEPEGGAEKAGQRIDQAASTTKKEFSDAWITSKVKEQFLVDSLVKGRRIEVSTRNHVVTLKGKVQSTEAQDRALSIARNTDGVDNVVDHLRINSSQG